MKKAHNNIIKPLYISTILQTTQGYRIHLLNIDSLKTLEQTKIIKW